MKTPRPVATYSTQGIPCDPATHKYGLAGRGVLFTWGLAVVLAMAADSSASAANTIVCWKVIASQPCIRTLVGDTEAGLPSSGVPEGFPAWAKDTDQLVCYYGGSWQPCNEGGGPGGDPTLAGDVDGLGSANDLDEAAVEAELEAVLDLAELQGAVADSQVPDGITVTLAATATALAADPSACPGGEYVTDIAASGSLTCAAVSGGSGLTHPQVLSRLSLGF